MGRWKIRITFRGGTPSKDPLNEFEFERANGLATPAQTKKRRAWIELQMLFVADWRITACEFLERKELHVETRGR